MSLKSLVSLVALTALTSASAVACAASTDGEPTEQGASQDLTVLSPTVTACTLDSDCVAVPRGGCCTTGALDAINKNQVSEYESATQCANAHPICALYAIHDTRVAQCNTATRACEMVQPAEIECGGFVANLHHCPSGFVCNFAGIHPDMPGKCVAEK
jgi:hypothetical protein